MPSGHRPGWLAVALLATGCTNATSPAPSQRNPFGVMLASRMVTSTIGIRPATELGAAFFRPEAIFADTWGGRCPPCDAAASAGLELVLTIRANGSAQRASSPPADLAAYRQAVDAILQRYRPALVAVENEENSTLFYTGTPEEYGTQLAAACQVAHRHEVPCTNGGLVSTLVALLVYHHYLELGDTARARDFAARAFSPDQQPLLDSPQAREQIAKGERLLEIYRTAGLDYLNFHWYIADTVALREAVSFLRERGGLPLVSNEAGQHDDQPEHTTATMQQFLDQGLPIVVWFGMDGPQARGLVNPDGSLRPTGLAFREFVRRHFR